MKQLAEMPLRRILRIGRWMGPALAISILISGCQAPQLQPPDVEQRDHPSSDTRDPGSYGMVGKVQKGVTTQSELIELFGGPNIATLDPDGMETWVYERTASETHTTSQSTVSTEANRLDSYFGLGLLGKGESQTRGTVQSHGGTTTSYSIRTLTIVVKFNADKTVKEYSARASYF